MKPAEKQIVDLLTEVLKVAKHLVKQRAVKPAAVPGRKAANGIYPHQSKYNPWRAYVWDAAKHQTVYLGAFPNVTKAKKAQAAYRANQPITSGTRAAKLRLVA